MTFETKHSRFLRLSAARREKAVYHIDLVTNLSSSNYEYSLKEAQDLIQSLQDAVDRVAAAFNQQPEPEPEPETDAPPLPVVENAKGPFTRGWVMWGYEMLRRGETAQCQTMLERALSGDRYT